MVRHATLNSEDPSCHCGPARHTELKGSQLIEENDEGEEGEEEEEEGGEETDIKSNNPHLTGGELPLFDLLLTPRQSESKIYSTPLLQRIYIASKGPKIQTSCTLSTV